MIEKGSINWASVSSSPLDQKPGAERIDRRGVEKSTAWGDDVHGKVAAELRSTAPSENEAHEKPTHRGDERRKKAETERRNAKSSAGRRGAETSNSGGPKWEKASDDQGQHLDGLSGNDQPIAAASSVRRRKGTSKASAGKIKSSSADLKSFAKETFPPSFCHVASNYPLKISTPTALNPLGGGFVWPPDLFPAAEDGTGL